MMKKIVSIFIVLVLCVSLVGCSNTESNKNSYAVIDTESEFYDNDVEGRLQYKIIGAKVYHSLDEAGISINDCTEPDTNLFEDDNDRLKDGWCMLVLDVAVKNIDAEYHYKNWDESIFRADSIYLVTKDGNDVEPVSDLCYFSMHDKCEEHHFAYRLLKEESCEFQVGHIVAETDLPITYASNCSSYGKDAVYVSLDFEEVD